MLSNMRFSVFFLPVALAKNIQTVLVSRFICGAAGSVGTTMVCRLDIAHCCYDYISSQDLLFAGRRHDIRYLDQRRVSGYVSIYSKTAMLKRGHAQADVTNGFLCSFGSNRNTDGPHILLLDGT